MDNCVYQDVQDLRISKDSLESQNKPSEGSIAFMTLFLT